MPKKRILLAGGTIVTPTQERPDCDLLIEDGKIAAIGELSEIADAERVDARGRYVLPGLVDLHTDALESEITPRPGANFPLDVALQEIDAKMLCCGITTVYHSLHLGYDDAVLKDRSSYSRQEVFAAAHNFAKNHAVANSRIHLRFELTGLAAEPTLDRLLRSGWIGLVSFMDHTPGQGQYPRELFLKRLIGNGRSEADAIAEFERKRSRPALSPDEVARYVELAHSFGIPTASHDDDTEEKVAANHRMGIRISEFPITLAAAQKAKALGMHVLGGASNILRGGSLTGNLCMLEAANARALDGLCSDYYPPSMLHSVFKLAALHGYPLHQATRMVSLEPAHAAGIDRATGSLEVGKDADCLLVELQGQRPRVVGVWVKGFLAYQSAASNHQPATADLALAQ